MPFDLRTLLIGLLRRSYLLIVCVIVAVPFALLGAVALGTRIYTAETVLLYRPVNPAESPSLNTQVNMVKIQANLAEIRRRLKLGSTLEGLGASLVVRVQKDTTLMSMVASADSAQGAADLANTTREVFLDQQRLIQKAQAGRRIKDFQGRLSSVRVELKSADQALQEFTKKHGITDLSREAQGYIDEQTAIEIMQEQAIVDQRSIELQKQNIDRIISDLKKKVAEEESGSAQLQGLGDLNIQVTRLRDAIGDDKQRRSNVPKLSQREAELEQARKLYSEGVISKEHLNRIQAEYEAQKAITIDTEQTKQWKDQIDAMQKAIVPSSAGSTASTPILRDMMLKSFEIQLQSVALAQKVSHLEEARSRIKQRLGTLAPLERDYATLKREVEAREAEAASIEDLLAKASRDHESNVVDFATVSEAKVPITPTESNRRSLFTMILIAGAVVGLLLMVGLEFADTTLKSGSELAARFEWPVWGVLPKLKGEELPLLGAGAAYSTGDPGAEAALLERFRTIARGIRRTAPQRGVRILVSSTGHSEGRTWIASNLAACFGRQDERVLLIDANLRGDGERDYSRKLAAAAEDQTPGHQLMTNRLCNAGIGLLQLLNRGIAHISSRLAGRLDSVARSLGKALAEFRSRTAARFAQGRNALSPSGFDRENGSAPPSPDYFQSNEGQAGLGDYLKGSVASPAEILVHTELPGVDVIRRSNAPVSPDRVGSERMTALLQQVSKEYSLVLVDGPPAAPYVDADVLAQHADLILFVVRSKGFGSSAVRKAVAKVVEEGKALGFILNGVQRVYLKAD